jgi:hypothetical protein
MERLRRSSFDDSLMAAGTTTEDVTYVNHHYTHDYHYMRNF